MSEPCTHYARGRQGGASTSWCMLCGAELTDDGEVLPPRLTLAERIEEVLAHAEANGHVLGHCQGVAPGERVPAARIDLIRAALEAENASSPA